MDVSIAHGYKPWHRRGMRTETPRRSEGNRSVDPAAHLAQGRRHRLQARAHAGEGERDTASRLLRTLYRNKTRAVEKWLIRNTRTRWPKHDGSSPFFRRRNAGMRVVFGIPASAAAITFSRPAPRRATAPTAAALPPTANGGESLGCLNPHPAPPSPCRAGRHRLQACAHAGDAYNSSEAWHTQGLYPTALQEQLHVTCPKSNGLPSARLRTYSPACPRKPFTSCSTPANSPA